MPSKPGVHIVDRANPHPRGAEQREDVPCGRLDHRRLLRDFNEANDTIFDSPRETGESGDDPSPPKSLVKKIAPVGVVDEENNSRNRRGDKQGQHAFKLLAADGDKANVGMADGVERLENREIGAPKAAGHGVFDRRPGVRQLSRALATCNDADVMASQGKSNGKKRSLHAGAEHDDSYGPAPRSVILQSLGRSSDMNAASRTGPG